MNKPYTRTIIIFSIAFLLTLSVGVLADLAREGIFTLKNFDATDMLFVMIIAFISCAISMIVVVALVTTRYSLAKTEEMEKKREKSFVVSFLESYFWREYSFANVCCRTLCAHSRALSCDIGWVSLLRLVCGTLRYIDGNSCYGGLCALTRKEKRKQMADCCF